MNIDPLEILFSDSFAIAQRKRNGRREIDCKDRHLPIVGAEKNGIINTALFGRFVSPFDVNEVSY